MLTVKNANSSKITHNFIPNALYISAIRELVIYCLKIICKKIPCYMRDSACRCFIVKKAKIFLSYVKHF